MSRLEKLNIFSNSNVLIQSWYWALPGHELKKNQVKGIKIWNKDIALFRDESGNVYAFHAFCPHMGAHLENGIVEKGGIRCFFHRWKFDSEGKLMDIPCRKESALPNATLPTYYCKEKYGLIWVFAGEKPDCDVPDIPELTKRVVRSKLGKPFVKNCHPNVVMINAIDAHHFTSVHNLPVDVNFKTQVESKRHISFTNTTYIPPSRFYLRFFSKFYKNYLTYNMNYWNGSTGSVTVGPDFLHCHIIFSLRPTLDGKTEGQTILVTPKLKGIIGYLFDQIVLFATKCVGAYFAKGDTEVFETIKFKFSHPIKEDKAIIDFILHSEELPLSEWSSQDNNQENKKQFYSKNRELSSQRKEQFQ